MKNLLAILCLSFSTIIFAQDKKSVEMQLTKMNGEVINSKMYLRPNLFWKNVFDEKSFYKTLHIVDDKGKKIEKSKPKI